MNEMFVGIDHGKSGAIAGLSQRGLINFVEPIPLDEDGDYDIKAIASGLKLRDKHFLLRMVVEKLQTLPAKMGGGIANFQRGTYRIWEAMAAMLDAPFLAVRPQQWQKSMLFVDDKLTTKERAAGEVAARWPADSEEFLAPLKKATREGVCDALLIAEYGRGEWLKSQWVAA